AFVTTLMSMPFLWWASRKFSSTMGQPPSPHLGPCLPSKVPRSSAASSGVIDVRMPVDDHACVSVIEITTRERSSRREPRKQPQCVLASDGGDVGCRKLDID